MDTSKQFHKMCDGEFYVWVEQDSSIHMKAVTSDGDPIEITFQEARELGRLLITLADEGEQAETR